MTLDQLKSGQTATITGLSSTGPNRRRLMDLGILPGTTIHFEMSSPLNDPIAYQVRGAIIALRREQAREIQITLETNRTEV